MPLRNADLKETRRRLRDMFEDTIKTFELIAERTTVLFPVEREVEIKMAIQEYLQDFVRDTRSSGEFTPKALIDRAPQKSLQKAGLYGAQLTLKERQVQVANESMRASLSGDGPISWRGPFKRWIGRINNFLRSLSAATGLGEALQELKDCLEGELPEDDHSIPRGSQEEE